MSDDQTFSVDLRLRQNFQLDVDFGDAADTELRVDEPPPLGDGAGPNAARLLAAAVGGCMSASLLYCLRRAHLQPTGLHARVEGTLVRNERGRVRVGGLRVVLEPEGSAEEIGRMARCRELFEEFCVVGQSVRQGIPVEVEVTPLARAWPAAEPAGGA